MSNARPGRNTRPRDHARYLRGAVGMTLVELLLAASIATATLAAAWPWFWNAASAARNVQVESQAHSKAAYATRVVGEELRLADGLVPLAPGLSPESSVCLRHSHPDSTAEEVVIAWNPSREVLWRKAPGTYLSDHVSDFRIVYYSSSGEPVDPATLTSTSALGNVTHVRIRITVTAGSAQATRLAHHMVGPR